MPKILALAGSARSDSCNKKLIRIAAEGARERGAEVTLIDMNDYPLPLYQGDEEEATGLPDNAKKLKKLFIEADGLLISSPEYNSSIPAPLKNLLDWVSRPEKSDAYYLVAFKGKAAALLSASPGALGGLRGLVHLKAMLGNVGMIVLPDQMSLPNAYDAFNGEGKLKDSKKEADAKKVGTGLAEFLSK